MQYLLSQEEYDDLVALSDPSDVESLTDLIEAQAATIDLLLEETKPPPEPNWLIFEYRGVQRIIKDAKIKVSTSFSNAGRVKILCNEVANGRDGFDDPDGDLPIKSFFVEEMEDVVEINPADTDLTPLKRVTDQYFGTGV